MDNLFKACTSFIEDFNEISTLKKLPQTPCLADEKTFTLNYILLKEELDEYLDASKDGDLKEVADALGDLFYVLWGMISKHGMQDIFLKQILLPICLSNRTKTSKTRLEAIESVKKYSGKREAMYVEINGIYGIFDSKTMKLIKGINFKEPEIKL